MPRTQVLFYNKQNESLSGLLELPNARIDCYAIFAHCFTCSKDGIAATYISRALAENGVAVLRFDFTGLGNSAGDFPNTNFSSNLDDLFAAAEFLQENYAAPQILIGHSLGGSAVLAVAKQIESVRAVVTINSPATAEHVKHLFDDAHNEILNNQSAKVSLGGRSFTIQKQFIEDLDRHNTLDHIKELGKALLVFHSPVDQIVSIDEATRIYVAAKHPKSFITLDQADHLLSDKGDANYVAAVITAWVSRYLADSFSSESASTNSHQDDALPIIEPGTVIVRERDKKFAREIFTQQHRLVSDEPVEQGGADSGANPYELLLAALGSCTSMTLRMYANHKKLDLEAIEVTLRHSRVHLDDCETCDDKNTLVDKIDREIKLVGRLDNDQRKRLLEIADKCPVHKTLVNEIVIETKLTQ
ncbi:MAG: bifunctional alpha/beta hydrolase/OsmC family protein [Nitrosomonas sp.]|nr:bifunctional alpha/beta hydrolase/OsmC family protein [Nitrosomonas sp.]